MKLWTRIVKFHDIFQKEVRIYTIQLISCIRILTPIAQHEESFKTACAYSGADNGHKTGGVFFCRIFKFLVGFSAPHILSPHWTQPTGANCGSGWRERPTRSTQHRTPTPFETWSPSTPPRRRDSAPTGGAVDYDPSRGIQQNGSGRRQCAIASRG